MFGAALLTRSREEEREEAADREEEGGLTGMRTWGCGEECEGCGEDWLGPLGSLGSLGSVDSPDEEEESSSDCGVNGPMIRNLERLEVGIA